MNTHPLMQPWIPLDKIVEIMQPEPGILIGSLCLIAWLIYKLLLRGVSPERHRNLKNHFRNLLFHLTWGAAFLTAYCLLERFGDDMSLGTQRALSYLGFFTILSGATVFVKVSRILAFEYLFLGHMRVAVPLLLVNLFTLLLSLILGGWMATEIFGVRLTPLLATSAIFSLVLGLALQDTLGNLFAGVALQFDKPYEIGDWIEVTAGEFKFTGQVEEISWRATVLIAFSEELITVPNRVMSQSEIANYSRKGKPVICSQIVRIPYGTDQERARATMTEAVRGCKRIRQDVAPFVFALEAGESWVTYKVVYYLDNFGAHFVIGDEVIRAVLEGLGREGIATAGPRVEVSKAG